MRNTKLHTICILALGSILTIGFEANAQLDPNMEAAVDCSVAECMFRGNSQPHDAIAGFQRLPSNGGEARLFKVNRFADNPDQQLNRAVERQFNPVGQVQTIRPVKNSKGQEGTGTATAFLVSPCYILTNNHAAFGDDFPSQPKDDSERAAIGAAYKMKFFVNVGVDVPFAVGTYATPVAWGDRDGGNRNDWALLKLSNCLGSRPEIGWMDLDVNQSSTGLKGKDVAVASYPSDRGDSAKQNLGKDLRLSWGKVTGYNDYNNTVRYSASTAPGSSGGVVTTTDQNGKVKVIGMHQGGRRAITNLENYQFEKYSDETSNQFLNMRDIIDSQDVRSRLIEDIQAFGKSNPNEPNFGRGIPKRQRESIA